MSCVNVFLTVTCRIPSTYYLSVDVGSCSEAVGTSFTAEDAATMSTEDARCVLCPVSMSFSHSHVVYPQLIIYLLMLVDVVKLSARLSLPRTLRRWARRMLGVHNVLCQCLFHRISRTLRRWARRMLGVYYVLCQCLSHRLLLFFLFSVYRCFLSVIDWYVLILRIR